MAKKRKQQWTHTVADLPKALPVNVISAKAFPILGSKTAANKAIESGRLFINGNLAKISDRVNNGDELKLKAEVLKKVKKVKIPIEIIYEDDHIIAVNKPAGIAVNGNRNNTVENAAARVNENNMLPDALPRPVAAHRIDLPTIGIVLLAKTRSALIHLGKEFQNSRVKKEYVAVVHGKPPAKGRIEIPLKNKKALTEFETVETVPSKTFEHLSLVKLFPITGRTHQLRIHLQKEGHFIVGDKIYSEGKKTILGKGLLLCARAIAFQHPVSKKTIEIQIDIPPKFLKVLEREKNRA